MNLDYKLLDALAAVIREGSFDKAARQLNLTQSAVSQRVKLLEQQLGQILLVRSNPPTPTAVGQQLLRHAEQVRLMEGELLADIRPAVASGYERITIGANADSLATWLLAALAPLLASEQLLIELVLEDQDYTHELLRDGTVAGCISTLQRPMQGCEVMYLGAMRYRCVAAPAFVERHFAAGVSADSLLAAPAVIYNRKDDLHRVFLETCFPLQDPDYAHHTLPSSQAFLDAPLAGIGYALVPELQLTDHLNRGTLIDLLPGRYIDVALYWHHWSRQPARLKRLGAALWQGCRPLRPESHLND